MVTEFFQNGERVGGSERDGFCEVARCIPMPVTCQVREKTCRIHPRTVDSTKCPGRMLLNKHMPGKVTLYGRICDMV